MDLPFVLSRRAPIIIAVVLLALLLMPAPLLPPHRLAEAMQSAFGRSWMISYLLAGIGLQIAFYGSLGLVAAFAVTPAPSVRGRLLQIALIPLLVVVVALLIRSLKMGHFPVWVNAAVPIAACLLGTAIGLSVLYRHSMLALVVATVFIALALWQFLGGASAELSRETSAQLERLVESASELPAGESRFGALLQSAFAPPRNGAQNKSDIEHNRAAILAWGIAQGDEKLARYVGLNPDDPLVLKAVALRQGATLRGRADWPRHYAVSAALAVLENPQFSEASGLMKEQLDSLAHGSGFSFADLAADRAGIRFAAAATASEPAAKSMQTRLETAVVIVDLFPNVADLPENLTPDQFRQQFGAVGSPRYRQQINEIDSRLDHCAALNPE